MLITLIPQRNNSPLSLAVNGETLTINGVAHDFSSLTDTQTWLEADEDANWNQAYAYGDPLLPKVRRDSGEIHAWVVYPCGADQQPAWEEAELNVVADGPIELPA